MQEKNSVLKILGLVFILFILFKKVLKFHFIDVPLFLGYCIAFLVILFLTNNFLSKKYLLQVKKYIKIDNRNVLIVTGITTGINFVIIFVLATVLKLIDTTIIGSKHISYFMLYGGFKSVFNFTIFSSTLIALYLYIRFTSLSKDQIIEEQKVITGNVSAQFESLKNQLDPHFLFNSLNVLSALIEEDQQKAVEFNNSLSKTYRYILDQKNKELVPLEEELAFAKTYIALLQMRFEDSLTFEMPQHIKQEGAKVVPLSLQLLLENVIKHNKATASKPIHIIIKEDTDGYLRIENNLNKKQKLDNRQGIGLQNIASRYGLLTSKPIKIEETEDYFAVRIPILTKIIEHMRIIDVPENEQEILIEAKKKVQRIKKFYAHLTSYIMVNTFLIMLNLITSSQFMWSMIVLFAWGIGLVSDAMKTYNYNLFLGKDWEDKKIREYVEKHKNKPKEWD